jgi:hypothetical protein
MDGGIDRMPKTAPESVVGPASGEAQFSRESPPAEIVCLRENGQSTEFKKVGVNVPIENFFSAFCIIFDVWVTL